NGDGTFAPAPGFPIRVASPPYNGAATPNTTAIVAGDFNHSGHLGLAVVDTSNAATYMLLGNGDGTFAPSSAAFARSPLFDVTLATADLNGDGNLDLTFQNGVVRSEEHTSELQSRFDLVCRLLLEKKKKKR